MLPEEKRIKTKEQLKEFLELEYRRYPLSGRRYITYFLQISEGAILRKHTKLLRTTEYHTNTGHKLRAAFYWARLMRLQNRYSLHVPINCCDKGLTVFHPSPIFINANVCIGKNCIIPPLVCISNNSNNGIEDLCPTIGDNVTLGISSQVLGDIYLADGITVGAGAVVTKSFYEPGISVAGVPAKKISKGDQA